MCDNGDKTKVAKIKIDKSRGTLKSLKHTSLDFSEYYSYCCFYGRFRTPSLSAHFFNLASKKSHV